MKIYGIKNCDTCRKAVKAFAAADKPCDFIDLRDEGLSSDDLDRWLEAAGWEKVLNRRSTSWRAVADEVKASIDHDSARSLMLDNPTLIKRPVFDDGKTITIGFGKAEQASLLG